MLLAALYSGPLLLHSAGQMTKSFGDRSFGASAPTLWNALLASLRNISFLSTLDLSFVSKHIF